MPQPSKSKSASKPDCHDCQVRGQGPLGCLGGEALAGFNAGKTSRSYQAGQIIFYEENKPFGLYCVASGTVKLTKYAADGKSYLTRLAKPGDLLGYRAFLTDEPYAATAEVLEPATLCFVERSTFNAALRQAPDLALQLIGLLGSELRQAEDRARDLAYLSVPERMAELLLTLRQSFGVARADGSVLIDISLSREDLAAMLGTTVETAVRTLTRFKADKLIGNEKKKIVLRQPAALAARLPEF